MIPPQDPRWKTAFDADPESKLEDTVEGAIRWLQGNVDRLQRRYDEFRNYLRTLPPAMAYEHYMGSDELGEIYFLLSTAKDRLQKVQKAWAKRDIEALMRLKVVDRKLADTLQADPVMNYG